MKVRTVLITTAGVVGAAGLAVGVGYVLDDDGDRDADVIVVDGVAAASTAAGDGTRQQADAGATAQPVAGLEELVGTLRSGDDPDDWSVEGVDLEFGPDGWLASAPAIGDFDGDGRTVSVLEELRSLEGEEVTIGLLYEEDDDHDDADVYTVNGVTYRDTDGGPAPWQVGTDQPAAERDAIVAAAVRAVGDGARVDEVERETDDGWDGWHVEVVGADGKEWDVYLDAAGNVTDVRQDS